MLSFMRWCHFIDYFKIWNSAQFPFEFQNGQYKCRAQVFEVWEWPGRQNCAKTMTYVQAKGIGLFVQEIQDIHPRRMNNKRTRTPFQRATSSGQNRSALGVVIARVRYFPNVPQKQLWRVVRGTSGLSSHLSEKTRPFADVITKAAHSPQLFLRAGSHFDIST